MKYAWNDERIELLTKLWAEGLSASQIAGRLVVTRNAVIGKIHRLKLSARQSVHHTKPRKCKPRKPRFGARLAPIGLGQALLDPPVASRARPPFELEATEVADIAPLPIDPPPSELVPLLAVGHRQCRWPFDGAMCCGRLVNEGSYCDAHSAIAFRPTARQLSRATKGA